MQSKFKILTLDGGGSKGMYSIGILYELEKKLKSPLVNHFDGFYGCSTGAIIAALLARGESVSVIKDLYMENIPHIMNCWLPSTRSSRLRQFLNDRFGKDKFDTVKKFLGIVSTSCDDKAPKIFKSDIKAAHGRKGSFESGFGATITDALMASCAAKPFFKAITLSTNITKFNLIDGGFSANNPTLFAIIDALKAFQIKKEDLIVINIGTGKFPTSLLPLPFQGLFNAIPFIVSGGFVTTLLDINTTTDSLIVELLLDDIKLLKFNNEFSDPTLSTNILESNKDKLTSLFNQGVRTFGNLEKDFDPIWSND